MNSSLLRLSFTVLATIATVVVFGRTSGEEKNYTYVIVHGATAGGYEWKETGKYLLANGHTVYRVALTALGERSHLARSEPDSKTNAAEIRTKQRRASGAVG